MYRLRIQRSPDSAILLRQQAKIRAARIDKATNTQQEHKRELHRRHIHGTMLCY